MPFGSPVEPDVYITYARPDAGTSGSASALASGSSRSRQTTAGPEGSTSSQRSSVTSTEAPLSRTRKSSRSCG